MKHDMRQIIFALFLLSLVLPSCAAAVDSAACSAELRKALEPMKECTLDEECEVVWVGCPLCYEAVNRRAVSEVEQLRSSYTECINSFRCKCAAKDRFRVKCEEKKCKEEFIQ